MPGSEDNVSPFSGKFPSAEAPARLFRSRAHWREELYLHPVEEIGEGAFAKMVRIAMSDPDDEIWAYSIVVEDRRLDGDAIVAVAKAWSAST